MISTDVIKEMKAMLGNIPVEKRNLLNDYLHTIIVKNVSPTSSSENNFDQVFKIYSGANTLYEWDNLNEPITNYLQSQPMRSILILQWIVSHSTN